MLKHTQGAAWISLPMSNWKKAPDKMKAHEASAWHKMAKAKVEAEKQCQAEGSVIFGSSLGKRGVMNRRTTKLHTDQEVVEDHVLLYAENSTFFQF